MPTEQEYSDLSASEKKKEDWMNSKWRPMMGWMYMLVCMFDFMVAPVLWSLTQAFFHGGVNVQWQPLTLQGAGLFHIAMGAVLGIAAYGRTQEKLSGANNGGLALPPVTGTSYTPPAPTTPVSTPAPSFGSSAPTVATPVGVGAPVPAFGSKPIGPAAAAMPAL